MLIWSLTGPMSVLVFQQTPSVAHDLAVHIHTAIHTAATYCDQLILASLGLDIYYRWNLSSFLSFESCSREFTSGVMWCQQAYK